MAFEAQSLGKKKTKQKKTLLKKASNKCHFLSLPLPDLFSLLEKSHLNCTFKNHLHISVKLQH